MTPTKGLVVFVFTHLSLVLQRNLTSAQAISRDYTVRLINTQSSNSTPMEGRLEISYNGIWGTVCDDGFTNASARVACASLGFGYNGIFVGQRHGIGTGKIWLDDVRCSGNEYGIEKCQHRVWGLHDCSHGEDVSISCGTSSTFAIRLVNSLDPVSNPMEGRLEIFYNGLWGTVCDDNFSNSSARVACASLGFGYLGAVIGHRHGNGVGQIWLDEVICNGTERSIDACSHSTWGVSDCSHGEDVSISCGAVPRLVNSLSSVNYPNEGRLQIYYAGQWGTVCDDEFTNISATVACASLGFGYVGTVISNRHGSGTGQIWLDNVVCVGTEQAIDKCSHNGWGLHNCGHSEDVTISCGATPRLVNSLSSVSNTVEGRLEIYYAGEWGTVCDDLFTNISAKVACESLGFGNIGTFVVNLHGTGTGRIWLDNVVCTGTELGIDRCPHNSWGINDCSHNEDVSISCGNTPNYAVRLINTLYDVSNPVEGRLEIYYAGVWGTVCDDSFTNASARVACASLGFGYNGTVIGNRHINQTGQIWLDDVICVGSESGIQDCSHSAWGTHNCGHGEDVSIRCGSIPELSVRLINSVANDGNAMEGQLEIYYSGVWGVVCGHGFTQTNARVACASLGFGYIGKFIGYRYGTGRGKIWLDDVVCNGTERSVGDCAHRPWGSHNCLIEEVVSIKCELFSTDMPRQNTAHCEFLSDYTCCIRVQAPFPHVIGYECSLSVNNELQNNKELQITLYCDTEDYALRLVNPKNPSRNPMEGRLEIYYAGVWGTVCDDGFTNVSAKVVCASLGYGFVGTYFDRSPYGAGTGKIWLDDVNCIGREPSIDKCKHLPLGWHNCNHNEDVSIKCGTAQNFAVRLVNSLPHSTNPKEGRLEIYYSGSWGTVCDDSFSNASATVVCASLGFGYIGTVIGKRHGSGTGQIWLDDIVCAGTEHSIVNCTHSSWGVHDCTHNEDVSISCGITTRLVNSLYAANNPAEGRLEIYYGGVWGTVCSDNFTDINAKVACASLGFGHSGAFTSNRHGSGIGPIWLDEVKCNGTEQSIDMCSRRPLGVHDCGHTDDVSIRCGDNRDYAVRLMNPFRNNSKEGRLEIYYSGIWGTVCDDRFTDASARVACASLGFGGVGAVIGNRHGGGTDVIWLDEVNCNGTESRLEQCTHRGWGVHNCGHSKDVSISCGTIARLVNSTGSPREGRLEIYYAGVWGTVCDDGFNDIAARVACASLGFRGVGTVNGSRYGSGTGPIWLDDVVCNGTETSLDQCSALPWGEHNCGHIEDVSISCETPSSTRATSVSTVSRVNTRGATTSVSTVPASQTKTSTSTPRLTVYTNASISTASTTTPTLTVSKPSSTFDTSSSTRVSTMSSYKSTASSGISTKLTRTSANVLSSMLTLAETTPMTVSKTSVTFSSTSAVSEAKSTEPIRSSKAFASTLTKSSPTMTTSAQTKIHRTSLMPTGRPTSTVSPITPNILTVLAKTSTSMSSAAKPSTTETPKTSLLSASIPVVPSATSKASEVNPGFKTSSLAEVDSEKPSGALNPPKSDMFTESSSSSIIKELHSGLDSTKSGYKAFWIIGIVGAIVIGILVIIIAVFLRRRRMRSTLGTDSVGFVDLLTLSNVTSDNECNLDPGFLHDDSNNDFSEQH